MSAEQVALIAQCAEYGERGLPDGKERWSVYLDADHTLVFFVIGSRPTQAEGHYDLQGLTPQAGEPLPER